MTTKEYLDAAKHRLKIESDYKLAKWLEIPQSRISEYRSGKHGMDNYTAARIANLLEINPLEVIADTNAEREKDAGKRAFWEGLIKHQGGKIAGFVLFFSSLSIAHEILENQQIIHYAHWLMLAIGACTWLIVYGQKKVH